MVPELRAMRLKEIAARVQNEFGGDLRRGLFGTMSQVRQTLKRFPNIADPGADRILLFGGIAPVAAVPSNCPHVLVRIQRSAIPLPAFPGHTHLAHHFPLPKPPAPILGLDNLQKLDRALSSMPPSFPGGRPSGPRPTPPSACVQD